MFVDSLPGFESSNSCVLAQLNNRRTFLITTAAAAALQENPHYAETGELTISANLAGRQVWQAKGAP